MNQSIKRQIKFAVILACAVVIPLVSLQAETFQVQVGSGGLKFTPQNVAIHIGDTVQWTWAASDHSSTSGTPGHSDGMWDSGVQNSGFVFSQTFNSAGNFAYYCTVHGGCCGMVGSVMVTAQLDTVQITRAQYAVAKSQLTVQATDTDDTATLTVSVTRTGAILGPMMNKGGGTYTAKFNGIANPKNITVKSDRGGSDTAKVKAR